MGIPNPLASFRKRRRLNQGQLAEALRLSKGYISQIENGTVPVPFRLALQIEQFTDGELLALDLLKGEDARLLGAALSRARGAGHTRSPAAHPITAGSTP